MVRLCVVARRGQLHFIERGTCVGTAATADSTGDVIFICSRAGASVRGRRADGKQKSASAEQAESYRC